MSTSTQQFFHVDRDGRLHEGETITLRPANVTGDCESLIINDLLPGGVSEWGQSMLDDDPPLVATVEALRNHNLARPTNLNGETGTFLNQEAQSLLRAGRTRIIEVVAEVVRQALAPQKPSRLACVYAYREQAMAEAFRAEQGMPNAPIWLVAAEPGAVMHMSDSRLLAIPDSAGQLIARTAAYWHGERRPDSTTSVEVLLPPPVTVVRQIA